jgi:hypothetical protein
MSSHVSPMRATILIPEPRDAAPLHSARATNAAAYHLYLNVTRLLAVGLKRRGLNGIKRSCPVCMHSPTVQRQICGR